MKKADSQLRPNRRQVLATMGAVGAVGLGGAMISRPVLEAVAYTREA